ncbi:MAG: zinc ribbon domain-containing protein [Clostridia bacterium]|nr:zinc ribbon domain-containing protein [Clostridia bacterium]
MGIFEDLYIKMRGGVCKIGDKTSKILNISKIKIEMAEKKNLIFEKYKLIGKYVYDMYENQESFEFEDIMDWLEEIKKLRLGIKDCEKRLHCAQNKLFCPYCNYKNESNAVFCSKCGKKISFACSNACSNTCSKCEQEDKQENESKSSDNSKSSGASGKNNSEEN